MALTITASVRGGYKSMVNVELHWNDICRSSVVPADALIKKNVGLNALQCSKCLIAIAVGDGIAIVGRA